MKKVTIAECKRVLAARGEKLPRVGYEKLVLQRVIEYKTRCSGLYPLGIATMLQDVYLVNYAGRLSVRYYTTDYRDYLVKKEYLQPGSTIDGWFNQ